MKLHAALLLWRLLGSPLFAESMPISPTRNESNDGIGARQLGENEGCPPCSVFFAKLRTDENSRNVQKVQVKERGEPKSGTGFMFEWAGGALVHACDYLSELFGESSCQIDMRTARGGFADLKYMKLTFQPDLSRGTARCPCDDVDRVSISIDADDKHRMPFRKRCGLLHAAGIAKSPACVFDDGSQPQNFDELWSCAEEKGCLLDDSDDQQMAIFRDPRPVVVSAYFFLYVYGRQTYDSVDDYVIDMFPTMCQWIALRYMIFAGMMSDRSSLFWYDTAQADPLQWHQDWLASVGLRLPSSVVSAATDAANRQEFRFHTKGFDKHVKADEQRNKSGAQERPSYKDSIKRDTSDKLDTLMKVWLPPALLAKFGILRWE